MPNMNPKKTPAVEQDPMVRNHNFEEVSKGYTPELAKEEAERCLGCKNQPCVAGCPVNVHIPEFIRKIREGDMAGSYAILRSTNSLPAVCGRVCPQETQCEAKCVRGIKGEPVGIGRLERYAADWAMKEENKGKIAAAEIAAKNGKKVAVVGSGPAGLTCAGDLAKLGYDVTIFEALHTPGGVLVYGIPEFRLPKALVRAEIANVEALGVKIVTNAVVGRMASLDELMEEQGFDAIFVGSGAGLPNFQKIPGENLNGVYSANEFLTRINLMKAYTFPAVDTPVRVGKNVAVIGGGNVAMDAARCAKRLGAETCTSSIAAARWKCPPGGGSPPRQGGGHHLQAAVQPDQDRGGRRRLCESHGVRGDGAGRARRLGPPPSHRKEGQRVRPGGSDGGGGHRQQPQPAHQEHHPRSGDPEVGRHHRRRGNGRDLQEKRLRGRRRRHRSRHRDPGHGRR
jgi:heterodisulfide reductase subunit C